MTKRFDADRIRQGITEELLERLELLEVFSRIESTNSYLMGVRPPAAGRWRAAIAEHQTMGRGQFDRTWVSPADSGLCMSLAYTFAQKPRAISPLSLALGSAVVRTLTDIGVAGAGLKWPNDIMATGGKLGGVLTEARATSVGNLTVVAGLGLNLDLQGSFDDFRDAGCDGDITDLNNCIGHVLSTTGLTSMLIESMLAALILFEVNGFGAFRDEWTEFDWLRGKNVSVETPAGNSNGIAAGIDDDGALLLQARNGLRRVTSGRVTITRQEGVVA